MDKFINILAVVVLTIFGVNALHTYQAQQDMRETLVRFKIAVTNLEKAAAHD